MSFGGFLTTIQSIMDVAIPRAYLSGVLVRIEIRLKGTNLPSENVLGMIISKIYLCWSSDRNSSSLSVPRFQQVRLYKICQKISGRLPYGLQRYQHTHSLLHPYCLAPCQLSHLHNVWEVELICLWAIVRCKHVLLPWFPK